MAHAVVVDPELIRDILPSQPLGVTIVPVDKQLASAFELLPDTHLLMTSKSGFSQLLSVYAPPDTITLAHAFWHTYRASAAGDARHGKCRVIFAHLPSVRCGEGHLNSGETTAPLVVGGEELVNLERRVAGAWHWGPGRPTDDPCEKRECEGGDREYWRKVCVALPRHPRCGLVG